MLQRPGHAQRLFCDKVSADKRDRADTADTRKAVIAADETLPAPGRAVRAVAGAVPDKTDDLAGEGVVRHAGGHVGVVVLDRDEGDPLFLAARGGVGGGEIVRVQVAGDRRRADVEELFKMPDLLFVILQRLDVLQIADMLAGKHIVPLGQAKAGLLLGPAGKDHAHALVHADREGHIAA